jgi:hypothetical protein
VRFHVRHPHLRRTRRTRRTHLRLLPCAHQPRDAEQRARLVRYQVLDLAQLHLEHTPPEARLVLVARVGANAHTLGRGALEHRGHDVRVAGVATARHVGRGDDLQEVVVCGHRPRPKALGQVGVEVDTLGLGGELAARAGERSQR